LEKWILMLQMRSSLLNFIKGLLRISYLKMRRDQFSGLCKSQLHSEQD